MPSVVQVDLDFNFGNSYLILRLQKKRRWKKGNSYLEKGIVNNSFVTTGLWMYGPFWGAVKDLCLCTAFPNVFVRVPYWEKILLSQNFNRVSIQNI